MMGASAMRTYLDGRFETTGMALSLAIHELDEMNKEGSFCQRHTLITQDGDESIGLGVQAAGDLDYSTHARGCPPVCA